jgi:hypothetical protein
MLLTLGKSPANFPPSFGGCRWLFWTAYLAFSGAEVAAGATGSVGPPKRSSGSPRKWARCRRHSHTTGDRQKGVLREVGSDLVSGACQDINMSSRVFLSRFRGPKWSARKTNNERGFRKRQHLASFGARDLHRTTWLDLNSWHRELDNEPYRPSLYPLREELLCECVNFAAIQVVCHFVHHLCHSTLISFCQICRRPHAHLGNR